MKTQLILAAFSLLLAAPAFASDRGPQPNIAARFAHEEHARKAAHSSGDMVPGAAMAPHDHAATTTEQPSTSTRAGGAMCGCSSAKHGHS